MQKIYIICLLKKSIGSQLDWESIHEKAIHNKSNRGFTLLEMTIVLIIITILTSAAVPALTQNFMNQAEQKVSLDINNIQNAALAYYVKNNAWPTSIVPTGINPSTDLESNGFLPTGWNATNPFGNAYSITNSGSMLTVTTQVASGTQTTIINQLPTSSFSGNIISSSVPVSGSASPLSVYDYGSSWSSYTIQSGAKIVIKQVSGIPGNSNRAITGLPYTNASSYSCACSQANAGAYNESPSLVINSGSQVTVYNNHVDNIGGNGSCNMVCAGW